MMTVTQKRQKAIWLVKALMVLLFLHMSLVTVSAQVRFGIMGGFQLTDMQFNHDALKPNNRVGWFAGPLLKIELPVTGLGIDVATLYDQRDLKVEDTVFKQKSLILQGSARCGVSLGDVLGIFMFLGPQFSFNVGDDFTHWITTKDEYKQFSIQETTLSVNMGVGVTFATHLEGTLRYNLPVGKTSDFTWNELGDRLGEQSWHHAKSRTNAWSVAVTYLF
ncbi:MAG: porin family protein [Prevotella sp.]|nr:porin family protein [Prevotella sp.]